MIKILRQESPKKKPLIANNDNHKSQDDNNNSLMINYRPTSPGSLSSTKAVSNSFPAQVSINKSEDKPCLESCKFGTFCVFYLGIMGVGLGLIGSIISYFVFGLKLLMKDYNESVDCNSDVGDFVLISLILSFLLGSGQANANKGDDSESSYVNIFLSFFWLGWGIWGFIITQEEDCEDLDNTNLVKYSLVISIYFMTMEV